LRREGITEKGKRLSSTIIVAPHAGSEEKKGKRYQGKGKWGWIKWVNLSGFNQSRVK